jgi:hypothetical protein
MKIAIIGTAGRQKQITKSTWEFALTEVKKLLDKEKRPITLVSGGSARNGSCGRKSIPFNFT